MEIVKSIYISAWRKIRPCVCLVTCTLPCVGDSDVCTHNLGDGLALFSGCVFVSQTHLFVLVDLGRVGGSGDEP